LLSWDPSTWLIWSLAQVGAAYDLKRVGPVHQWNRRVRAAIEHGGTGVEAFARLHQTRAALERQIADSRARLAHIVMRAGVALQPAPHSTLEEISERWANALREAREAVGRESRRRAERARELVERLRAYQSLLEQLVAHEAVLAGASV
jgi:hypothetical protein